MLHDDRLRRRAARLTLLSRRRLRRRVPFQRPSRVAGGNRRGYAGYEFDPALAYSIWHVRNRVLNSDIGRWNRRDPADYVDGANLFAYAQSQPNLLRDPSGLACSAGPCNTNTIQGDPSKPSCKYYLDMDRSECVPRDLETRCCHVICTGTNEQNNYGRVGCCNGRVIACVCQNNSPWNEWKSDRFRQGLINCTAVHECENARIWRCKPDQTPPEPPYYPGGSGIAAWCPVLMNECRAWELEEACIAAIDCGGDIDCNAEKGRYLIWVQSRRENVCAARDLACGGHQ